MQSAARPEAVSHPHLLQWVKEMAELCAPDAVVWCDGSGDELRRLTDRAVAQGEVERLNPDKMPGCLYAHSDPNDVARVESATFICTPTRDEAGPTNNWMDPAEAYRKLGAIFRGSMRGRTMYVVPYLMGPAGSPFSKVGVELTDSLYVVLNMRIMTRMGVAALRHLGASGEFTKGLHGKGALDPVQRFICHFPQDNAIWSVNSNYGGNVLLGKKSLALRLASWMGRREGWMAEHMLVMGVGDPAGGVRYVAAAFPSQCGKTNLAMLVPPASMPGWKVWTVGDDIAWMRVGDDGRLWAVNPEAGFFGVAPGTSRRTNPSAMDTIGRNTIYTNVVKKDDGTVWWEGHDDPPPAEATDWRGQRWTPGSGRPGAHPNSRFTAPAAQCPHISPEWENPAGVPISAILFGGRRNRVAPLVYEAFDWAHGVYLGATLASETTAAATGQVGVVRRDPMAMLPFCGYDMGRYWQHWLDMGRRLSKPPRIFHVNWFRKEDPAARSIWPGFGENLRVLKWALDRCEGKAGAERTPIGWLPRTQDLWLDGSGMTPQAVQEKLLSLERADWLEEARQVGEFFDKMGPTVPAELRRQREEHVRRWQAAA